MTTNPLTIRKDAIFICGSFLPTNGQISTAFAEAEELIAQKGYEVINPAKISSANEDRELNKKEVLAQRMSYMAMCDNIVTLEYWASDEDAKCIITAAQLMGKKIIHFSLFDRFEAETKLARGNAA